MSESERIATDKPKGRPRIYWGWYVVAAAFLTGFVASSAASFTFSVIVVPMSEGMGWTRTQLFLAITIAGWSAGVTAPVFGRLVDKYGARYIMTSGALLLGLFLLLTSQVRTLWEYYLVFGVGIGLSRPLVQSVGGPAAVVNWFIRKRNRVLPIISFATPASVVMTLPVAFLAENYGWRWSWVLLALTTWTLAVIPAWLFIRRRPEDMGLLPDGDSPQEVPAGSRVGSARPASSQDPVWRLSQVMRTRTFWLITAMINLTGVPGGTIILHMGAFFRDKGFTPAEAASGVFLYGVGAGLGRLFWGVVGEWFNVKQCLAMRAFAYAVVILVFLAAPGVLASYAAVLALGITVGGGQQLDNQVWADYYGRGIAGTILGVESLFGAFFRAGGPLFAAWMFDTFRTYNTAFSLFSGLCVLAGFCMLFANKPIPPDEAASALRANKAS